MEAVRSPSAEVARDLTPDPGAPGVVAVVVTCDPGEWLEECLASLARQDYPELSVLVIDVDSREDPTPRVAAVMPTAYVRRARRRRGFGAACNEVLTVVEGAALYAFCHDDVVLDPSAVRLLVEEAFRSNAGVVAPKLVAWESPEHLLAVGMGADRFGVPVPLVERGELDQQQHDAVRDVFFAPSPCMLVRADLFATLKGFDPGCGVVGEDLDLAWRAHLAGARVVAAPRARVRHLEVTESGQRAIDGSFRGGPGTAVPAPAPPGEAVADDDARGALAPPEAGSGVEALAGVPEEEVLAPAANGTDEVWDLARWDEEDDAAVAEGTVATRRAGRRSARPARHAEAAVPWSDEGEWSGDEEWEVAGRRRHRRAPEVRRPVVRPPRGPDADALDARRAEARLRAVASDCAAARAVVRLPVLMLLTLMESAGRLVRGEFAAARRPLQPWGTLFVESGAVRKRRALVHQIRAVPDRAVTSQQVGGVSRLRQVIRDAGVSAAAPAGWDADARLTAAVWAVSLLVLGYGSRRLLVGHLPTVGELAPWPSVSTMFRTAWSGWRSTGLGAAAAGPVAFVELGVAGVLLLGHTGVLQHLAVLGMVPLGALGAVRLARALGSRRATLVALVGYLVVPLPYNALYAGRWSGLVVYAALPWLMAMVVRATRAVPFHRPVDRGPGARPPRPLLALGPRIVGIALLGAVTGAIVPAVIPVVVVVGLALLGGFVLAGPWRSGARAALAAVAGAAGALVLLAPWSLGWLPPAGEWATFSGVPAGGHPAHLATLLRFQTGTLGAGPLGYAVLVVGAFPLVAARGWRLSWAIRLWVVALASFGMAWAAQHAALGIGWPAPEVVLAPAAVAIALSAGLGVVAFETDLRGYNFGWRQAASAIAAAAALLACLPVAALAVNGRWRQPTDGFDTVLSWMAPKRADGDFRVLWVGDPSTLPAPGWRLSGGIAYATSVNGPPSLLDRWPASSRGATRLLGQAVTLAREGRTTGLGHLLAPMGVRYLVVVQRSSPLDANGADTRAVPRDLTDGLDSQLDMDALDRSTAMTVYRNDAWAPIGSQLPAGATAAALLNDPRAARSVDLAGAPAVVRQRDASTSYAGAVPAGATVALAAAPSSHWQLTVDGHHARRQAAWGSANVFTMGGAAAGGVGTLRYRTPVGWRLALLVQLLAWVAALVFVVSARRRAPRPSVDAEPATGEAVLVGGGSR